MLLIIRYSLWISLLMLTKFKWINWFQIFLILEAKFTEDLLHIFDNLNKFKVSLLHEETSEIWKKYFVGCYAPQLKDGIYAVTNVSIEISMYIQMFILMRTAFFLEGIQMIQFHKKSKQMQQDRYYRYFVETNKKIQ